MTRFRERLPQLTHVERDYAREMIAHVHAHGRTGFEETGSARAFAWLADEWYHIAGETVPPRAHYEEFPPTGRRHRHDTAVSGKHEAARTPRLPARVPVPIEATLVTAEMPAAYVQAIRRPPEPHRRRHINVCVVKNDFFGGDIHIAGLLTAQDILPPAKRFPTVIRPSIVPKICLRDDTFCSWTT